MTISILSYAYDAYKADFSGRPQRKQDLKDAASTPRPGDPSGARKALPVHHQASGAGQPDDVKFPLNQSPASSLDEII